MLLGSGATPAPAEAYNKTNHDGQGHPMAQRRTVLFSGEVQGVGFRAAACRLVAGRPVTGFVRNLPDGRVELVAESTPHHLDALITDLRNHFGLMIEEVDSTMTPATDEFIGFGIRR